MEAAQKYLIQLADTALIQSHRLQETIGRAPELEIEMALANIGLDLLGQCRYLYQTIGKELSMTEDQIAMGRDAWDIYNPLIAEQPNGDFAMTVAKNFYLTTYTHEVYSQLLESTDQNLQAFARKSLKEIKYHREYFNQWVIRLGDGTQISHDRMQSAIDHFWDFTGELFTATSAESQLDQKMFPIDLEQARKIWNQNVNEVMDIATLQIPKGTWSQMGGKEGRHSEHLGFILTELRYMQMAYPDMKW